MTQKRGRGVNSKYLERVLNDKDTEFQFRTDSFDRDMLALQLTIVWYFESNRVFAMWHAPLAQSIGFIGSSSTC